MSVSVERVGAQVVCFNLTHVDVAESGAHMQALTLTPTAPRNLIPVFAGKLREYLVCLTAQHNVCLRLAQRRTRRARSMRPDENSLSEMSQCLDPHMRNAQLGLGAAPEQVGGCCGDDDEIRLEGPEPARDIRRLQRLHVRVNQLHIMSFPLQKLTRGEKLQRQ